MMYPCAKFHHDMTFNNRINCISHAFCYVYFWINNRGLSIMTLLSMASMQFFSYLSCHLNGLLLCKISL